MSEWWTRRGVGEGGLGEGWVTGGLGEGWVSGGLGEGWVREDWARGG